MEVSSKMFRWDIFRILNSKRPNLQHSANHVYVDNNGIIYAVRCGCGRKICHPVRYGVVIWEEKLRRFEVPNLLKPNEAVGAE